MKKQESFLSFFILCSLICLGIILYFNFIRPFIFSFGNNFFDLEVSKFILDISPADTYAYWFHATNTELKNLPYNLLGPVLLIKLTGGNFDLILLLNFILFYIAVRGLFLNLKIPPVKYAIFVLANPLILFQFLSPNKEFMIIICLLYLVLYSFSGKLFYLFLSILVACFTKPPFFLLVIAFLCIRKIKYPFRPFIYFFIMVFISLLYAYLPYMQELELVLVDGQTEDSLGFTILMQKLASEYYLFFVVIVPRLILLIGEGAVSQEYFILTSGLCFFVALIFLTIKGFHKINDLTLLLFLFCVLVAISPFPMHRYILPMYPLLVLLTQFRPNFIPQCNPGKLKSDSLDL